MPYRVYPGGLSVSRSFGDFGAKLPNLGGKWGVLIADPEIQKFVVDETTDFLYIGCDGIFDVFSSKELGELLWK